MDILDNDSIVSINILKSFSLSTNKQFDSDEYAMKITTKVKPNDPNGEPNCDMVFDINAIC